MPTDSSSGSQPTILSILKNAGRNFYPLAIAQVLLGGVLIFNNHTDTATLSVEPASDDPTDTGLLANLFYLTSLPEDTADDEAESPVDYPSLAERHEQCVRASIAQIEHLTRLLTQAQGDEFDRTVHESPSALFQACLEGLSALNDTLHCTFWPNHQDADAASWQKFAANIVAHASAVQACLTILDGLASDVGGGKWTFVKATAVGRYCALFWWYCYE